MAYKLHSEHNIQLGSYIKQRLERYFAIIRVFEPRNDALWLAE
jgi:hypothetical protein